MADAVQPPVFFEFRQAMATASPAASFRRFESEIDDDTDNRHQHNRDPSSVFVNRRRSARMSVRSLLPILLGEAGRHLLQRASLVQTLGEKILALARNERHRAVCTRHRNQVLVDEMQGVVAFLLTTYCDSYMK